MARPGLHKRQSRHSAAWVPGDAWVSREDGLPGGAPVPGGVGGVARPGLHKRQSGHSAARVPDNARVSREDGLPGGAPVPGGGGRSTRPTVTLQRHPYDQPGQVGHKSGPGLLPWTDRLRRLVREPGLVPCQAVASSDTKAWRLGPTPGGQATAAGAGKYLIFRKYFSVSMFAMFAYP